MPDSHLPQPHFDRCAYLLLVDDEDRLMLCGTCCSGWTVPRVLLDPEVDFRDAATQFLADRFQIHNPKYGTVYGVRKTQDSECWEHEHPTVAHVLLVRISSEESDSIQRTSTRHARWGIGELKDRHREISPEGVVLLVSGYVEGWIPDGKISLH
ncbi:hypothetical protein RB628_40255 [Streptomyces sp. ADMS]|uniref:hypothetical protein n=1 Tax=Streptomyces sp. ADMS TaxID=3071415 RepID=UPI00296EE9D7|nr:hypothetical protein [Streptomyces sp. ADMS]MDW4911358.1 hypothetical protein [Streptomyces sp. ADMS]